MSFRTDDWFTTPTFDTWDQEKWAKNLITAYAPLGIGRLITQLGGSPISAICQEELKKRAREYQESEQSGTLPVVSYSSLVEVEEPSALIASRLKEVVRIKPIPWLFGCLLEQNDDHDLAWRFKRHVHELFEDAERTAQAVYSLFSKSFSGEKEKIKRAIVSQCGMVMFQDSQAKRDLVWLSWDQVVDRWLANPDTAMQAKDHAHAISRALANGKEIPLQELTTPFKNYVIRYSIHKIFKENLAIDCPLAIRNQLFAYFSEHDTARIFALYFTAQLALGNPLKRFSFVTGTLQMLVDASELLFMVGTHVNRSLLFELLFSSSQQGRDFFRKHWLASKIEPIVTHKFQQAWDVITLLSAALGYEEEEKLELAARAALLDEPSDVELLVTTFFTINPKQSLLAFLQACEGILGSTFCFTFSKFKKLFEEKSKWADAHFITRNPQKRVLFVLHEMAPRPQSALTRRLQLADGVRFNDEGTYSTAWIASKSETLGPLVLDIENILRTTLPQEELILFLSYIDEPLSLRAASETQAEIEEFLESIEKYPLQLHEKALLLLSFFRNSTTLKAHMSWIARFESLVGHDLPAKVVVSCLYSQSVPGELLDAPERLLRLKHDIQSLSPERLSIPHTVLIGIKEIEVALHTECLFQHFGSHLASFARLSLCSTTYKDEAQMYAVQPFFPLSLPYGTSDSPAEREREDREFLLMPEFPEHSKGYRYAWKELEGTFIFHLELFTKITKWNTRIEIGLEVARQELEAHSARSQAMHWIIRLLANEPDGSEEPPDPRTHIQELLAKLEVELPLALLGDEAAWQYLLKAYHFAHTLRRKVRVALTT